jgi:DNA mismatch endonuclease (patch repair protein)
LTESWTRQGSHEPWECVHSGCGLLHVADVRSMIEIREKLSDDMSAPLEYPVPSSEAASRVMRGNRGSDTKPEIRVRSELHRRGLRFRKQLRIDTAALKVRPDIVFSRQRLAVFMDGCFWHRCPEHGSDPRSNTGYWSLKLQRNVERDQRVATALTDEGWTVLRIWEHVSTQDAANQVQRALHDSES